MSTWPDKLFDLAYFPSLDDKLDDLSGLAETENWDYQHSSTSHNKPVLYNYLQNTYRRLREEDKVYLSDQGDALAFNTGLVTDNQEEIFCFFTRNRNEQASQDWYCVGWRRAGENDMSKFSILPPPAHYFDDPSVLVLDPKKEIRANIEHIIVENRERFPSKYREKNNYELQTYLKGALEIAKQRVRRNYKAAVPHYYKSRVQLLLPLSFESPTQVDLAIVIEDMGNFYRASTCLTLDMAYNNARLLAKPDRDWLTP